MPQPLLQARQITKRFPGVVAVDRVSFDLRPGEVHALVGENGAGKSTLIKVLSGVHPHGTYEGDFDVDGRAARFRSVKDAQSAGLAVIYQELALVDELSVAENIFLGRPLTRRGLLDWPAMFRQAAQLLNEFDLRLDPAAPVSGLGLGQRQLVEIAKALSRQSRIVILDEPTAALSQQETATLIEKLRGLRARGLGCVYISHRLDEVFALADRITVLRDGQSVRTLTAADTTREELIRLMVGREIRDMYPRQAAPPGELLLAVDALSVARPGEDGPALRNISFGVRGGEVLGIGGLMGAGRSELLRHLAGAWGRRLSGRVTLRGQVLAPGSPRAAIRSGMTLLTEDRKRDGLVLGASVGFNLSLSSLASVTRPSGLVDADREFARNRDMAQAVRLRAPSLETDAGQLSGGNQQKVLVGKALLTEPAVVLMDEPTRGIDVGAKIEIYELINRLTARGQAVVLVSSELPELLAMSDRILILHEGAISGAFARGEASQERLMAAALGQSVPTGPGSSPTGPGAVSP